jgi:hypothetical protein
VERSTPRSDKSKWWVEFPVTDVLFDSLLILLIINLGLCLYLILSLTASVFTATDYTSRCRVYLAYLVQNVPRLDHNICYWFRVELVLRHSAFPQSVFSSPVLIDFRFWVSEYD